MGRRNIEEGMHDDEKLSTHGKKVRLSKLSEYLPALLEKPVISAFLRGATGCPPPSISAVQEVF